MGTDRREANTGEAPKSAPGAAILVLEDEDLFIDFLERFPSKRYALAFAGDLEEAARQLESQTPRLLVAPLPPSCSEQLATVLRQAQERGASVLGAVLEGGVPAELAEAVDRQLPRADVAQILEIAGELLEERRARPRVKAAIPLIIEGVGALTATVISARSLFVPTDVPFSVGQMARITIGAGGEAPIRFWAKVVRIGQGESGEMGAAFGVAEREQAARAFLDGMVRGSLLLEFAQHGGAPGAELSESMSAKLNQRMQARLVELQERVDEQLGVIKSLTERVEDLARADSQDVKWKDVRPLLARKLLTLGGAVRTLTDRVEELSSAPPLAKEMKEALETQASLQRRLAQQAEVSKALERRIEELAASTAGQDAGDRDSAHCLEMEGALLAQASLLESLKARLDELDSRDSSRDSSPESSGADGCSPELEEHAARMEAHALQLSELTAQVEGLQGRLARDAAREEEGRGTEEQMLAMRAEVLDLRESLRGLLDGLGDRLQWVAAQAMPAAPGEPADQARAAAAAAALTSGAASAGAAPWPASEAAAAAPPSVPAAPAPPAPAGASPPPLPGAPTSAGAAAGAGAVAGPLAPVPARRLSAVMVVAVLAGLVILLVAAFAIGRYLGEPAIAPGAGAATLTLASGQQATAPAGVRDEPGPASPGSGGEQRAGPEGSLAGIDPSAGQRPAPAAPDGGPQASPADDQLAGEEADGARDEGETHASTEAQAALEKQLQEKSAGRARKRPPAPGMVRRLELNRARRLLSSRQEPEAARQHLTKALKLKDDYVVRELLARSHEDANELWAAAHHLHKAATLSTPPLRITYQYRLGMLFVRLGQEARACRAFAAALADAPDHVMAKQHHAKHCQH